MGKQDLDNTSADDNASIEDDDFDNDEAIDDVVKPSVAVQKDMRRILEDKLEEVRLNRILSEFDFKDI